MKSTAVASRAQCRAENWYRGKLWWKLHAGQARIEKAYKANLAKLFVANCSRRIGKTYWDTDVSLEVAIAKPKARVHYVSAFLTDLEEFAIPSFEKALADCPGALRPTAKLSKKKWVFPNGSEVKMIGLDKNPNGLRGNFSDLIVFAEAGLIRRLGYLYSDVCLPMTMYREGARVIMDSTPPETPDHEFRDFCERAQASGSYVHLTIYDNPMLSAAEIEEIHQECLASPGGETTWRREYLAEFVVDQERAIVPEWSDAMIQVVERPPTFQYLHRYDAMDLGVVDQTACLFAWYDFPTARIVVEDELVMSGPAMTTDLLAEQLRAKENALWGQLPVALRVADNDNLLLIQDLGSKYMMHFMPTGKDSLEAMVNQVRIWVKAGRVVVHPRCKHLIGCLRNGIWDEARKKFNRSTTYGHYDALAALIYLVRNVRVYDNPIPANLGLELANWAIPPSVVTTAKAREISKLVRRP
jgi:hypothetical protein